MECAREDNIFVGGQLLQALREVSLIDQTASLIDNEECKDDPEHHS